jgi:acyl-CoA synthetase (AMP-forming)/AMP-acid ligase II
MTAAPNFGYEYAQRVVRDREVAGADLSSLRCAIVGAEPVRYDTLRDFTGRFGRYGLRRDVFVVSYGMAESTLASAMAPPSRPPRYVVVGYGPVAVGKPVPVLGEGLLGAGTEPASAGPGVAVFSVGRAVDGLHVELLDDDGAPVTDDAVLGEITLRGSSVSVGYLDPRTGAPEPFPGGTLSTGDLGFVHRGDLFILERKKHVIIRNGRNFLASLLEQRVAEILGVPVQELIAVDADIHDPASAITVIVENTSAASDISADQHAALRALDLPVDVLHFARKRVIPRTTSGKKKYHECRRLLAGRSLRVSHTLRLAEGTDEW